MTELDRNEKAKFTAAALSASLGRSLKRGDYDLGLLATAQRLNALVDKTKTPQSTTSPEYLKRKCMISEVFDYFGRFNDALKVLSDGPQVLEKLRRRKSAAPVSSEEARMLAREEVRFCLEYAQTFYRSHHYQTAKVIVTDCQSVVTNHISDEKDFPCFGTCARTMYYLGRVHRQMNDYERAKLCFIEAINYHHQRAKRKLKGDGGKIEADTIREELDFARHKSALCMFLGLGWLSYTRGALVRAKSYIMPARVLLLSTSDIINSAYLQLIQGAIERSLAGRDKERLAIATDLLQDAGDTFEKLKHTAYLARAAFELSLAHLYAGNTKAAVRECLRVQEISAERNDVRWGCNSWILESRIRRAEGNVQEAERLASKACTVAGKRKQFLCKIDALIARGEAKMLRRRFASARVDFKEALKINAGRYRDTQSRSAETTNQKIDAVCHLNIARSYIVKNDSRQAQPHLERWHELRERVEHVSVREFGDEVQRAFKNLRTPFVIPADPASLNFKKHRDALFEWLTREAQHQSARKGTQADLLGLSREGRRKRGQQRKPKKA